MGQFLQFVFLGLSAGAIYSVLASSLVGIYAATGIINFAQGAIGLYSVYLVAALRTDGSLVLPIGTLSLGSESDPTSMELAVVLGVLSAVVWALLAHVLVFRPLRSAPVLAQVVASVGLMLFIQALVHLRFETENLFAEAILPESTVDIAGAIVNVSDLILAGVAIAVSLVLWAYFRLTTLGVATRAGSEDELAARLSGYSPDRLAGIVWALTGAATGLIVVLASYTIGLTETSYTFFVIPALAVALVGRLTSSGSPAPQVLSSAHSSRSSRGSPPRTGGPNGRRPASATPSRSSSSSSPSSCWAVASRPAVRSARCGCPRSGSRASG